MGEKSVGGLSSIKYSIKVASEVGYGNFWKSIISKNTCKTCAYGMGGQKGGMRNEAGTPFEICKKSIQAQLTDIQSPIPELVFRNNSISDLQSMSGMELEKLGRLNFPIYKGIGDSNYIVISWEEALRKIIEKFKATDPLRTFFYSSGRSSNEAAFLLSLFARVYGTNNVNNCSYYCHQASGVGLSSTIGSGTATIEVHDLKSTDLIFVIGANPSSNHPRFLTELMHCRRRGGNVVIINPAREPGLVRFAIPSDVRSMLNGGSDIASEYVQPNIGGDIALFKGIAKVLLAHPPPPQAEAAMAGEGPAPSREEGESQRSKNPQHLTPALSYEERESQRSKNPPDYTELNMDFINNHTIGFEEFKQDILSSSWDDIIGSSGVSREQIERVAELYADAKNVVFSWSMGITHHKHGVENVESIVNLALLRGMVGRKHAGLLPLRGHSNVQGIGSVGVTPALKEKIFENIQNHLGVELPTSPGMDTMACIQASAEGKIDAALLLGGNLYSANPNSRFAEKALGNIPFKVYLNTTLNKGHVFGVDQEVIVLPCAARDEEKQPTTQESMFNFVRISDGGIVRLNNVRSEVDILSDLAIGIMNEKKYNLNRLKTIPQ